MKKTYTVYLYINEVGDFVTSDAWTFDRRRTAVGKRDSLIRAGYNPDDVLIEVA